ncbi:hypothetical protein KQX54_011122 [Cotesia glomerata]|uniref:BEN domain-containing protein n=1 Tax=Cotesia glomerata TaxID=32391 RepID=A0AAV7IUR9_COTGL|nr:hypothetical protein KQX54_006649 [Cotesia glomerata]KAH0557740.1 hypothetical protein KQX54_011122 [Cotesia glomerata]
MSAPKIPLLALVQWIGGEYDLTYTAGVPVDWIFDFDPSTFESVDEDVSYVIEWRESSKNKKPKKGWKCFDARVVMVSRSLNSLERELAILEGIISPLRPERTLETIRNNLKNPVKRTLGDALIDSDGVQSEIPDSSGKKKKKKKKNEKTKDTVIEENENGAGNAGLEVPRVEEENPDLEVPRIEEENPDLEVAVVEEEIVGVNQDQILNQQIHRDNQAIKRTLDLLVAEVRNIKASQTEILQRQVGIQNPPQDPNAQVEIGHAGSNVFVSRNQWDTANSRDTFHSMGKSLVKSLFPEEVLLRSNFQGGASKINKNAPQRLGLNRNIMAAIKEAVKQKFPADFKQTLFGMSINNMMTEMRRKAQIAVEIEDQQEAN